MGFFQRSVDTLRFKARLQAWISFLLDVADFFFDGIVDHVDNIFALFCLIDT